MANVTIPPHDTSNERGTVSQRALAQEQYLAEKQTEEAKKRRASLDAPWYNEKLDPTNFGSQEYLDPQHIAMFNGTEGGRRHASFPERTLDTGLSFNPTPQALRGVTGDSRDSAALHHPEVLTSIIQELWSPSTSHGALGQALAVATDAPPSVAGPAEPPLTISPPLDPEDLPEPPPEDVVAPEGSLRAKRREEWAQASEQGGDQPQPGRQQPSQQPAEEQERKRQQEEQKREQDAEKKRQEEQQQRQRNKQ